MSQMRKKSIKLMRPIKPLVIVMIALALAECAQQATEQNEMECLQNRLDIGWRLLNK